MIPRSYPSLSTRHLFSAGSGLLASLLMAALLCTSCSVHLAEPGALSEEAGPPEAAVERTAGFDYPGGWSGATSCVDICGVTPGSPVARPPAVVCFDPNDPECAAKTGDGDYDYLMLSQHWLPTLCAGLAAGYDSTVTHRDEARCRAKTPNRLTIHGLWQNYEAGFPQCCGDPQPLDPAAVRGWPPGLRQRLESEWPDPTTTGFDTGICEMLNHEWQKHGTCMAEQTDRGAQRYVATGLDLAERLAAATASIDGWAGTTRSPAEIQALYDTSAQILCDAAQPEHLLEIHTCWSRNGSAVDCPPARGFGQLAVCGERVTLPVNGS